MLWAASNAASVPADSNGVPGVDDDGVPGIDDSLKGVPGFELIGVFGFELCSRQSLHLGLSTFPFDSYRFLQRTHVTRRPIFWWLM